jgi:hypothetical protein
MTEHAWLILTYKVPSEPSRKRLAIWRKLKSMGAVYLQNGVCLLPKNDDHQRQLKILQNDIREMGGESFLLEAAPFDKRQEELVLGRFKEERDAEYQEFLGKCADYVEEIRKETEARHFTYAELEENDEELKKLVNWLKKIEKVDFYGAALADKAREAVANCERLLDEYSQKVFAVEEHNVLMDKN